VNQWTHLALTRSEKSMSLYLNGELISQKDFADAQGKDLDYNSNAYDDNSVSIGKFWRKGHARDGELDADLDDWRLYDVALTADQVKSMV